MVEGEHGPEKGGLLHTWFVFILSSLMEPLVAILLPGLCLCVSATEKQ